MKYDALIIGGGPAAVSAALTLRNRGKTVGVISNPNETQNLYKAEHVTNYPGIVGSGKELSEKFTEQLISSGAELIHGRALSAMSLGAAFGVAVGNDFYEGRAIIAATGISRSPLCDGETKFLGRGVSYCATCDGMLYRGKTVAAIGSGEEFESDVRFLKEIGCTVECFKGGRFEIEGDTKAELLIHEGREYKVDCVFILKDTVTADSLLPNVKTERGRIVVDAKMRTSVEGIFAAGDCTGAPYQLAKAVGEGNIAALSACEYLDKK